ncbi:hypothetical protein SMMN14_05886 [Sphaerulina musiva]
MHFLRVLSLSSLVALAAAAPLASKSEIAARDTPGDLTGRSLTLLERADEIQPDKKKKQKPAGYFTGRTTTPPESADEAQFDE